MKRKIENLLKTNPFLNKTYTLLGSLCVRILGLFVTKEPKLVLFVSYMGKNFNDSPKMIYDAMINDPYFKDYRFVWAFNDLDKFTVSENTEVVKMDSLQYLMTALKANYWITNVNIERGLHFKKSYTKYINTWHGVPLKKIGNDVQGRSDFNFSSVDLFCYSGAFEANIYEQAFKIKPDNMYLYGMPRNDVVIKNNISIKQKVLNQYNIQDKKIILYAPTWREDANDLKLMDISKWQETLSDEFVLMVKGHGLSQGFNIKDSSFVVDVTDYEETSELIVASDILITDYSSIMFDFALTSKPVMIYAPDLDKYVAERGVYFDIKETGLHVFEDDSQLLDGLKNVNHQNQEVISKTFVDKFIEVRDPNSTEKIVSYLKKN